MHLWDEPELLTDVIMHSFIYVYHDQYGARSGSPQLSNFSIIVSLRDLCYLSYFNGACNYVPYNGYCDCHSLVYKCITPLPNICVEYIM